MINSRARSLKTFFAGMVLAALLAGCDTVDGMREMKDAQGELQGVIEEQLGVESIVGFNMSGEHVIEVTIALSAGQVVDRSVSELVRAARKAVESAFDTKPQVIYIELVTTAE